MLNHAKSPPRQVILLLAAMLSLFAVSSRAASVNRAQILTQIQRCATAEISMLPHHPRTGWVHGVLYIGLIDLYRATGNQAFLQPVLKIGNQVRWRIRRFRQRLNSQTSGNSYCFGQAITSISALHVGHVPLAPLEARCNQTLHYFQAIGNNPGKLAWWWCDSLFMAPTTLAHLSMLTGNSEYLNAMNQQWWRVAHLLYDKKEHLFFRDHRFLKKNAANGQPVFWSRGEGWVLAGTARVLKYLPQNFPDRPRYINLFRQMAAKIASLQGSDGIWRPSLLDFRQFPTPESSGTALDCYALAWGINHHLLSPEQYLPVVAKAWAGLLAMRNKAGDLANVQKPGDQPAMVTPDVTEPYASGAFIMAGVQLMKLAPFTLPPIPRLGEAQ
ncbi:MAG: glycoside hydrolase family 88/105 protein [Phycisphaerae bacterium]